MRVVDVAQIASLAFVLQVVAHLMPGGSEQLKPYMSLFLLFFSPH
jgi:hypothetical protein